MAQQTAKHLLDGSIGGAGITTLVWWDMIEPVLQGSLLLGGTALLFFRLLITIREWRNGR